MNCVWLCVEQPFDGFIFKIPTNRLLATRKSHQLLGSTQTFSTASLTPPRGSRLPTVATVGRDAPSPFCAPAEQPCFVAISTTPTSAIGIIIDDSFRRSPPIFSYSWSPPIDVSPILPLFRLTNIRRRHAVRRRPLQLTPSTLPTSE